MSMYLHQTGIDQN